MLYFSECYLPVTYKATGDLARSNCSLVCKYSFVPPGGWNEDFLRAVGLDDLVEEGCARLGGFPGKNGSKVLTAGLPVAKGLTKKAAEELGLKPGTPVGSAVVDAYVLFYTSPGSLLYSDLTPRFRQVCRLDWYSRC